MTVPRPSDDELIESAIAVDQPLEPRTYVQTRTIYLPADRRIRATVVEPSS